MHRYSLGSFRTMVAKKQTGKSPSGACIPARIFQHGRKEITVVTAGANNAPLAIAALPLLTALGKLINGSTLPMELI